MASVAGRSRSSRRLHNRGRCSEWVVRVVVRWCVGSTCHLRALIRCRVFVLIPILASLGIARISAHPDIATYAYATALFSDGAAEGSAFCEARELLRFTRHTTPGLFTPPTLARSPRCVAAAVSSSQQLHRRRHIADLCFAAPAFPLTWSTSSPPS